MSTLPHLHRYGAVRPAKAKLSSRLAGLPKERKSFFSKRPRPTSYLARMGGSSEAIVLQAMKAAFHLLCGLQSRYMMASTTPSQVEPRSLRAVARSASPQRHRELSEKRAYVAPSFETRSSRLSVGGRRRGLSRAAPRLWPIRRSAANADRAFAQPLHAAATRRRAPH